MIPSPADPLSYLCSLEQYGIKLGLDNIRTLTTALNHPERSFQSIVVAGTNGKGSVAAMIERSLRAAGYKTGRYTSPHLVALSERFVIDGRPVTIDVLRREASRLRSTIDTLRSTGELAAPPTFFEATTAIALSLFRQAGVSLAVLEVGMGGRFDATNIVTPVAVVIPSIDLDHQQFLGSTLAEIAFEKAGVIGPGAIVVTGESKVVALEVLRRIADERGARFLEAGQGVKTRATVRVGVTRLEQLTTPWRHYEPLTLALNGRHQVLNAIVAVRLLEEIGTIGVDVPVPAIRTGLIDTLWRGRLELVRVEHDRSILLDAAHNVAAATALGTYVLEAYPGGLPFVFGALRDKDVTGMLRALGTAVTRIVCAPMTSSRAWTTDQLAAIVRKERGDLPVTLASSPQAALEEAWTEAATVVATGSIYLIGELIDALDATKSARVAGATAQS